MTRHTVIPDIHADFERLQQSLRHASAGGQVAFLGDFIDAGKAVEKPAQLPNCRCHYKKYIYRLEELPKELLSKKGMDALDASKK